MLPPPDVEHRRDAVAAAAGDAGDVDVEHASPTSRRSCSSGRRRRRGRCRRCCRARRGRRTSSTAWATAARDAVVVGDVGGDERRLAAGGGDRVDDVGRRRRRRRRRRGRPRAANSSAATRPSPAAAPVISATLPSSRPDRVPVVQSLALAEGGGLYAFGVEDVCDGRGARRYRGASPGSPGSTPFHVPPTCGTGAIPCPVGRGAGYRPADHDRPPPR